MRDFNKVLISRLKIIVWAGTILFILAVVSRVALFYANPMAEYLESVVWFMLILVLLALTLTLHSFRRAVNYNAEMSRFAMQMLIHDLKNPLTSIMMSLSIAKKEVENNPMTENILILAEKGAQLQQKIMDTVNEVDALESGEVQPSFQDVDLKEVIAESSAELDTMTHDKHLSFDLYGALNGEFPSMVRADRLLLKNTLSALLLNSYKYAPRNSVITLKSGIKDGTCVFEICDKGTQLNPGDEKKIFSKYLDRDVRKRLPRKGLGFSLYYAYLAVVLCGGVIKAFNRDDSVITEFSLPQSAPAGAAING